MPNLIPPYITLQASTPYDALAPNAPTVLSIEQASGIVVVGFVAAPIAGPIPTEYFNLYRSLSGEGDFSLVATNLVSLTSVQNLIFDRSAEIAVRYDYYVCAVDQDGNISQPSNIVSFVPFDPVAFSITKANRNLSNAAFGPYPVLGSDLYLDPTTKDLVIGPNGDYMQVTGLECLAQDLRIKFFTEIGELALHQEIGFNRATYIGSGIANATLQAQRLYNSLTALLLQDPRVYQVIDVLIAQNASDAWILTYIVMAIGVEDAVQANIVVPFVTGGSRTPAVAVGSTELILPSGSTSGGGIVSPTA